MDQVFTWSLGALLTFAVGALGGLILCFGIWALGFLPERKGLMLWVARAGMALVALAWIFVPVLTYDALFGFPGLRIYLADTSLGLGLGMLLTPLLVLVLSSHRTRGSRPAFRLNHALNYLKNDSKAEAALAHGSGCRTVRFSPWVFVGMLALAGCVQALALPPLLWAGLALFVVGTLFLLLLPPLSYDDRGVRLLRRKGKPSLEWSQLRGLRSGGPGRLGLSPVFLDAPGGPPVALNVFGVRHYRQTLVDLAERIRKHKGRDSVGSAVDLQIQGRLPFPWLPMVLTALVLVMGFAADGMVLRKAWARLAWPVLPAQVESASVERIQHSRGGDGFRWTLATTVRDPGTGLTRTATVAFDGYYAEAWKAGDSLDIRLNPADPGRSLRALDPYRSLVAGLCALLLMGIVLGYVRTLMGFYTLHPEPGSRRR